MRILIVGDIHGHHQELATELWRVQNIYRISAAIQVGDFGLTKQNMEELKAKQTRFPVPLHVIDGNHEDHAWLAQAIKSEATKAWKEDFNLVYQARSSLEKFGSTLVGFLGGALHADRPQQLSMLGHSANYILRHERAQATELFNKERPSLIVSHSCPSRIGIGMCGSPKLAMSVQRYITAAGFDAGDANDCGEAELQRLWEGLDYRPRTWVFGHFHCMHQATVDSTHFACIDSPIGRTQQKKLAIWDSEEQRLLFCPYLG